jgi:hypothetical protein
MDFIEIDNINAPYSNNDVYLTIKYVLKTEPERFQRWSIISYLIQYISDEKLLTSTIELFKEIDFLTNKLETANNIVSNNNDYSALEKIKITAITHSLILTTEINLNKFSSFIIVSEVPALQLNLNNRRIEHNSTEIGNWIKRNSIKSFVDTTGKLPTLSDQENAIKKLIQSMSGIDYLNDSKTFLKEIDYLSVIKKNLFEEKLSLVPATENKHPNMFVNDSFKLFEYILNTHITENRGRINDISFYYWKMYNGNYIIQKPYPFVEWFTKLYDVESFQMKTLNTTQNSNRLKHYSNSLDWFKLQNQ